MVGTCCTGHWHDGFLLLLLLFVLLLVLFGALCGASQISNAEEDGEDMVKCFGMVRCKRFEELADGVFGRSRVADMLQ